MYVCIYIERDMYSICIYIYIYIYIYMYRPGAAVRARRLGPGVIIICYVIRHVLRRHLLREESSRNPLTDRNNKEII